MPDVRIKIENKVASLMDDVLLVCGNSDYTAVFDFDEEWGAYEAKTARFITVAGHQDVVFSGNRVAIPVLTNTPFVRIGVFAGDLHTTTPAEIFCQRSVLCAQGSPVEPPPDVYAQLMQMVNDGRLQGEPGPQGERGEKGEKGDAGSIKFIPVVELPTENIDTNAIYLQKIESEDEQNRFTEYAYIDGKWETLGAISIQVDHSEYVKFTDMPSKTKAGAVKINEAFGIDVNSSGALRIFPATNDQISKRAESTTSQLVPITTRNLDYATMSALADCKDTTLWTDKDKTKACETIGAVKKPAPITGIQTVVSQRDNGEIESLGTASFANQALFGRIPRYQNPAYEGDTPASNMGMLVTNTPTKQYHCANKKYVDNGFVPKQNPEFDAGATRGYAYVIEQEKNAETGEFEQVQKVKKIQIQATSDTIPLRNPNGNFYVGTPTLAYECTNKGYVDGLIAELRAEIEALKNG